MLSSITAASKPKSAWFSRREAEWFRANAKVAPESAPRAAYSQKCASLRTSKGSFSRRKKRSSHVSTALESAPEASLESSELPQIKAMAMSESA